MITIYSLIPVVITSPLYCCRYIEMQIIHIHMTHIQIQLVYLHSLASLLALLFVLVSILSLSNSLDGYTNTYVYQLHIQLSKKYRYTTRFSPLSFISRSHLSSLSQPCSQDIKLHMYISYLYIII